MLKQRLLKMALILERRAQIRLNKKISLVHLKQIKLRLKNKNILNKSPQMYLKKLRQFLYKKIKNLRKKKLKGLRKVNHKNLKKIKQWRKKASKKK